MGIREKLNQNPAIAGIAAAGVIVVIVAATVFLNRPLPERLSSAYYSDDLGKTYFADDVDKPYPFDHNGKRAYRAYVYRSGNDAPFVSYIARYNDNTRRKIEELAKLKTPDASAELMTLRGQGIEVCKVGTTDWVPINSAKGGEISSHPIGADGQRATNISP